MYLNVRGFSYQGVGKLMERLNSWKRWKSFEKMSKILKNYVKISGNLPNISIVQNHKQGGLKNTGKSLGKLQSPPPTLQLGI